MGDMRVRRISTTIGRHTALAAICGTTILASGTILLAQQRDSGNEIRFGVSTTLRHDTNQRLSTAAPGGTTDFSTDLSFGVTRQTQTSLLDFNASGALSYQDAPTGTSTDANVTGLRLYYEQLSAAGKLSIQARVNESDLDTLNSLVDPITGDLITVEDPGRRRSFSTGVTLEGGLDSPVETRLSLTRSGVRYYDTLSPSYSDSDTWSAEASARLQVTPLIALTPSLSYTEYEAQDVVSTRRETTRFQLGMSYEIDQVTQLTAGLGYSKIDQSGAAFRAAGRAGYQRDP